MLRLIDVSHRLPDGRQLFEHVDLEVSARTKLAIVGPSGVGKSTLLGIMAGLVTPTAGRHESSFSDDVSWILQDCRVLEHRTVLDNVCAEAVLHGDDRSATARRAVPLLDTLELGAMASVTARHLSRGERQRVVVIRSLLAGRGLVLADEPTSHLDRPLARAVMSLLLTAAPGAVVVVTHDTNALPAGTAVLGLGPHGLVPVQREP